MKTIFKSVENTTQTIGNFCRKHSADNFLFPQKIYCTQFLMLSDKQCKQFSMAPENKVQTVLNFNLK